MTADLQLQCMLQENSFAATLQLTGEEAVGISRKRCNVSSLFIAISSSPYALSLVTFIAEQNILIFAAYKFTL